MAINDGVSFTWIGHGTWLARSAAGKEVLIDPWVMNNPVVPAHLKQIDRLDVMVVTHGHFDHIHDAVAIGKATSPKVIAQVETAAWLERNGVPGATALASNKGGNVEVDGIEFTMTHADHSCGISEGDQIVYGGEAVGYVIKFENGFTVYFAGDTGIFGDMALIGELYKPEVAFLPIGGHFVMEPLQAAKAAQLLGVRTVVPMHFGTFPILDGTPAQVQALTGPGIHVLDIKPGDVV